MAANPTLTVRQIRLFGKPLVFAACLLPLLLLLLRTFELGDWGLGPNPGEVIQDTLGLWALRLLLLTLAITPLRWLTGAPWPLQFRRMLGLFAFTYAALHFLAYLLFDQGLDYAAIVEDVLERPFITLGFGALVLMLPLAVTSTDAWRRRLGRRWQRLHRVVYLIGILACWHFYWQVKQDVREPLVYAAILVALLAYRWWHRRAPAMSRAKA